MTDGSFYILLQQHFGHTIRENIGDYLICFFFLISRRTDSTSSSVTSSSRRLSSSAGDSSIEGLLHQVVLSTPAILDTSLPLDEVKEILKKLTSTLSKSGDDLDEADIRSQIYLTIGNIVKSYPGSLVTVDFNEDWLNCAQYVLN